MSELFDRKVTQVELEERFQKHKVDISVGKQVDAGTYHRVFTELTKRIETLGFITIYPDKGIFVETNGSAVLSKTGRKRWHTVLNDMGIPPHTVRMRQY